MEQGFWAVWWKFFRHPKDIFKPICSRNCFNSAYMPPTNRIL